MANHGSKQKHSLNGVFSLIRNTSAVSVAHKHPVTLLHVVGSKNFSHIVTGIGLGRYAPH